MTADLWQSRPLADIVLDAIPDERAALVGTSFGGRAALEAAASPVKRARYAGRAASASPATGLAKRHASEQAALVSNALGLSVRGEIRRKKNA